MQENYDYVRENCQVVGISGGAGVGKDYIAKHYFIDRWKYYNVSFAWHFKMDAVAKGFATYEEVFVSKPPRVRKLLQILGTEQGRNLWGETIWVDTTVCWIRTWHEQWGINKIIIPDVRFPNELETVRTLGGLVYRVTSNMSHETMVGAEAIHASETSLSDDPELYDGMIHNVRVGDPTYEDPIAQIQAALDCQPHGNRYLL